MAISVAEFGSLYLILFSHPPPVRDMNRNLIAILNCFLVVVGSFAFVYKAVEYSLEKPNIPLVGLTVLFVPKQTLKAL